MTVLPDGAMIRPATPEDADDVARLHLEVWADACAGLVPDPVIEDRRARVGEQVERWREVLGTGEHLTVLAIAPAGLVGLASAGPGRDNDVALSGAGLVLELTALQVRAGHRGTGIGYALLEAAVGDRAAYLWVLAGNARGIRFCERQGFRLDGTEDELDGGRHVRMLRAGTP